MEPFPEHIDPDLLIVYLSGEANPKEESAIQKWLAESEDNRAQFDALQKLWQEAGTAFPPPLDINTDVAWDQVSRRIEAMEAMPEGAISKSPSNRIHFGWSLRIAAVLLPLIAVGLYFFFSLREPVQLSLSSGNTISSGQLPDGSQINLNKNSEIKYPEKFSSNEREISLSGEAFLKVNRDTAKPFIVHTPLVDVVVLGTEFNVRAYPGEALTEVYVQSGRVAVYKTGENQIRVDSVFLDPGYKGIYHQKTGKLERVQLSDENGLFWLSKKLEFRGTELAEVFRILEKEYAVTIEIPDSSIAKLRLTSSFQNQPIDRIMEIISTTLELNHTKNGTTYEVEKSGH
jgi:transmembrane sensor